MTAGRRRRSWALPLFIVTFLGGALVTVLAGGDEAEKKASEEMVEVHPTGTTPPAEAAPAVPTGRGGVVSSTGVCLADQSAVEDIKRRRAELEAREKELAARESELKAREGAVSEELRKIEGVRADVEKIEGARRREGDEKVAKLVETFETMSPKTASQLLSTLDESLAVAAMAKIATPKLAKIMNSMEPKRSARLSELLAGVVRARNVTSASIAAAATPYNGTGRESAKGGDSKNDRPSEQHDSKQLGDRPTERREPGSVVGSGKEAGKDQAGKR